MVLVSGYNICYNYSFDLGYLVIWWWIDKGYGEYKLMNEKLSKKLVGND